MNIKCQKLRAHQEQPKIVGYLSEDGALYLGNTGGINSYYTWQTILLHEGVVRPSALTMQELSNITGNTPIYDNEEIVINFGHKS